MSGGAAIVAMAEAQKALGGLVHVEPEQFLQVLGRTANPLVVTAAPRGLAVSHHYVTSYKGILFHAKSRQPLTLPRGAEVVKARKISMPLY